MTKGSRFKTPNHNPGGLNNWVEAGAGDATTATVINPPTPAPDSEGMARLTIDLPRELHTRFKTACVKRRSRMVQEVTRFIETYTQQHEG